MLQNLYSKRLHDLLPYFHQKQNVERLADSPSFFPLNTLDIVGFFAWNTRGKTGLQYI